jgi:hypothetical protein
MGLGGILQELKTEGVLALYHDYRSVRLVDYSGNGNNGTAPAGAFFTKAAVNLNNLTTAMTIADNGTLRLGTLSVIVLADFVSQRSSEILYAVSVFAGSARMWFYMAATPTLNLFDGTSSRTLSINIVGKKCVSMSVQSGQIPLGYADGIFIGNFSGTLTPPVGASLIEIGNTNFANSIKSTLKAVVVVSRVLTATEHARVYGQLENMTWNTKGLTPGPMMP